MKILAGTTLTIALSALSVYPALSGTAIAQTTDTMTRPGQTSTMQLQNGQMSGQVQSVEGSTVTVRMSDGSVHEYQVEPATISALNLSNGSTVIINSSLMTGVVTRISRYSMNVKLDNGETENFIAPRIERGVIAVGDRIVITPDRKFHRTTDYVLTAKDLTIVQPVASTTTNTVGSTSTTSSTTTQVETNNTTTETTAPVTSTTTTQSTTVQQQTAPVPALW
jgi:hypothetical protein